MATDVLLVDDYDEARETIAAFLESEGYRVACAADGREALEKLRSGIEPRVILLDLQMPRMSGSEFRAEQLKDPRLSRIPVVVYSASNTARRVAAMMGVAHWLAKPADGEALLALVGLYCSDGPARRRGPSGTPGE